MFESVDRHHFILTPQLITLRLYTVYELYQPGTFCPSIMPLKRTPPASPCTAGPSGESDYVNKQAHVATAVMGLSNEPLQHSESAPDLYTLLARINDSKKRKFDGDNDESSLVTSFKEMFDKLANKIEDLHSTINTIKQQNIELTKSVEVMSFKHDEFLSRVTKLEEDKVQNAQRIKYLEDRLEFFERKNRSTSLEIRNVMKEQGETKDDLCKIVTNLGSAINVDLQEASIKDIYRINAKDKSNPIIVDFTSVLLKEKVIKGTKIFNKTKSKGDKLNSSHLKLKQRLSPVFISEALTLKSQRLFYLARLFQKQLNYAFCWTSHGVVYLRKNVNSSQIRITTEEDIEALRINS